MSRRGAAVLDDPDDIPRGHLGGGIERDVIALTKVGLRAVGGTERVEPDLAYVAVDGFENESGRVRGQAEQDGVGELRRVGAEQRLSGGRVREDGATRRAGVVAVRPPGVEAVPAVVVVAGQFPDDGVGRVQSDAGLVGERDALTTNGALLDGVAVDLAEPLNQEELVLGVCGVGLGGSNKRDVYLRGQGKTK